MIVVGAYEQSVQGKAKIKVVLVMIVHLNTTYVIELRPSFCGYLRMIQSMTVVVQLNEMHIWHLWMRKSSMA